ncbi:hypothetical protein [Rufibacter soli]
MNELASIRTNIYYQKNAKSDLVQLNEIIIITHKPTYNLSNSGEVVKGIELNEFRFTVHQDKLKETGEFLIKLSEATEEDLI